MKTYWITKYALTEGIIKAEAKPPSESGYISVKSDRFHFRTSFKVGTDAFLTEAEAKANADKKRLAKIASVKKQIAKLEAMRF